MQKRVEGLQAENAALRAGHFENATLNFTYAQATALCQRWEPRARLAEMFALPGALRAAEIAHCSAAVAAECNRFGHAWHDAIDGVGELTAKLNKAEAAAAEQPERVRTLILTEDANGNVIHRRWVDGEGA